MKFYIYKDKKNEWRWRLKARNGRIVADSGEGYKSRSYAVNMIDKMIAGGLSAHIYDEVTGEDIG